MPRRIKTSIFAALVSVPFLNACAVTPTLPPGLHNELTDLGPALAWFKEPPLWPPAASDGYQRRLRLFLFPPRIRNATIRIDTSSTGETTGHVVLVQFRQGGEGGWDYNHWDIIQDRTFTVSPTDLAVLNDLIAQSELWQIYPQHWVVTGGSVCVDGVVIVMERAEHQQYRFSEANAQCTAPPAVLKVAAKMIDMAGFDSTEVADWLR